MKYVSYFYKIVTWFTTGQLKEIILEIFLNLCIIPPEIDFVWKTKSLG